MAFTDMNLIRELTAVLEGLNYTEPTPIQEQAIPALLEGHDLIGIAQTGTGKTAAFSLPILQHLAKHPKRTVKGSVRVLILAPTRELAAQIRESMREYGSKLKVRSAVIFGGVGQSPQVSALRQGVDVLVATPGRLLDLMNQGFVDLHDLEIFVLDEADRMLDMGFIHDVKKVISHLPKKRQTLFFSATMPPQVAELAKGLLVDPVRVEVTPQATTVERVDQKVLFVDDKRKNDLLLELLEAEHLESVLIFTRTKHRANKVAKILVSNGIRAEAIHGNKSQTARTQALRAFSSGKARVLVATDIAARGIDVDDISHVINYDIPDDPESYVHRIGRTARAGREGVAYSFCDAQERDRLRDVEKLIRMKLEVFEHRYHSQAAQDAKGAAARPPPKTQRSHRPRPRQNRPKSGSRRVRRSR